MKRIIKLIACLAVALILSSCANTGNQGGTDDDTHIHKVLHWEMVNDADCENGGNRFGMCIDCGNEVRDDLSALDHIYIGGVCARCGKEDKTDGAPEFTFELNSEKTGYIIASALVTKKNVVIPSTYMGLPVVKIAQLAFLGADEMENLIIPDSVSSIGMRAFAECENLKYVQMSEGLTSIGECAFEKCTSLREISFPKTLEKISYGCFILLVMKNTLKCFV